ncbi:MAG: oxygen-independent coproporphyrinogen III oxidase [Clostridia bacterium]|nr:oxygen-independent coproporphyrinogen III oxidase [Clostridia bacterium]
MKEFGIYVHIPFCRSKCYYCDFISFGSKECLWDKYIDALIKEIEFNKKKIGEKNITTIYIGGGTPSIINSEYITKILSIIKENYNIKPNCEITIEVNPGTITRKKLEDYKNAGVNRLSIGLQSTNNNLLKEIGRIHTYEQFLETYKLARECGFENINVDLMLALPNQKLSDLEESITEVIKLNPKHISVYSLILEEGTKLYDMVNNNELSLPDDEIERKMYWTVKNKVEEAGYRHYEISNFSKPGFESKHNLNCWNQEEYIGFGLAAHSYMDKKRFYNIINLEEYIKNIEENNFEKNSFVEEIQNDDDMKKEYMMLGLRKIEGVSIQAFKNKFIDNPLYIFNKELEKLVNEELLEVDLDNIRLTSKGLDFANLVWQEFV